MSFMHANDDMMNEIVNTRPPMSGDHGHHGMQHGGDSDPHAAHSMGGSHGGEHSMAMYFHFGYDEIILFSCWTISSVGGLIGSMVALFWMAMLYEGLKVFREYLLQRTLLREKSHHKKLLKSHQCAETVHTNGLHVPLATENGDSPDGSTPPVPVATLLRPHPFTVSHLFQTFLHMLQVFISYLLMLVFMTYNVWLSMAVVMGAGAGYFLFGWCKKTIVDINEHCH